MIESSLELPKGLDLRPQGQEPTSNEQAPGGRKDVADEEDTVALIHEVLPGTLRWLYGLRITLYTLGGLLALAKVLLAPTVSAFLLDILTDSPAARHLLEGWVHALQSIDSGLLAATLSLVIATFLIQARLVAQSRHGGTIRSDESETVGAKLPLMLKTLEREAAAALLTGILTFGISELLSPGAIGTAAAFALLAGIAAGGINTLFFHLLFIAREPPIHAAEKRYRQVIEQAQARLADGSMRLQEALIGRFEADYRRTAATNRALGSSRRQVREARRQFRSRLWVIDQVVPRNHLVAFTAQARTDPNLLERWTEEVDWLVNASREVLRKDETFRGFGAHFRLAGLAQKTIEERQRFANTA